MWALITEGRVREIVAEDPAGRFHPSLHWQPCDESVAVGDTFTGTEFRAPPPAPAARRELPTLAFRYRFTAAERGAITLAASRDLEVDKPALQVGLDDLNAAGAIDLDSPVIREWLDLLAERKLIEAGRIAEILA